jgi:hypothetical protein
MASRKRPNIRPIRHRLGQQGNAIGTIAESRSQLQIDAGRKVGLSNRPRKPDQLALLGEPATIVVTLGPKRDDQSR